VAGIVFSDTELFSNLELTQAVYDLLLSDKQELEVPLFDRDVILAVQQATKVLMQRLVSREPVIVPDVVLQQIVDENDALYRDSNNVKALLEMIGKDYQ